MTVIALEIVNSCPSKNMPFTEKNKEYLKKKLQL